MWHWNSCASALIVSCGLLVTGPALYGEGSAMAGPLSSDALQKERHPHIQKALRELREARRELVTGAHDFGGHRAEAVAAVDVAIKQLEIALKYDKR